MFVCAFGAILWGFYQRRGFDLMLGICWICSIRSQCCVSYVLWICVAWSTWQSIFLWLPPHSKHLIIGVIGWVRHVPPRLVDVTWQSTPSSIVMLVVMVFVCCFESFNWLAWFFRSCQQSWLGVVCCKSDMFVWRVWMQAGHIPALLICHVPWFWSHARNNPLISTLILKQYFASTMSTTYYKPYHWYFVFWPWIHHITHFAKSCKVFIY